MNHSEVQQILKKANESDIELSFDEKEEDYSLSFNHQLNFRSFQAAKYFLSALITEKDYLENDFKLTKDLHSFVENHKNQVITEYDAQKTLKIDNKTEILSFPLFLVFTSSGNVCKVQNQNFLSVTRIIEKSELEADERPIYIMGTKNYSGFLMVAFDNGKVGKIEMNSYQTEFNRKKLKGAFNTESRLIFIEHIAKETDFAALSDINKVVVFNSGQINAVSSRNTKGVQVMKSKDRSMMIRVKKLEQVRLAEPDYYRSENLNVVGYYLKDGDEF